MILVIDEFGSTFFLSFFLFFLFFPYSFVGQGDVAIWIELHCTHTYFSDFIYIYIYIYISHVYHFFLFRSSLGKRYLS